MAWFKVDDGFWAHPKVLMVSPDAGWLWLRAGSWSAQQLTDGFIPTAADRLLGDDGTLAAQLVDVGLWEVMPEGWAFHGWDEFQPTRDDVLAEREKNRERQRRWRESHRGENGRFVSNAVTNGVTNTAPSRPVPTQDTPVVTGHLSVRNARESDDDQNLASFFGHVHVNPDTIREAVRQRLGVVLDDQGVFGLFSDMQSAANATIRNGTAYILKALQETPFEVEKHIHDRAAS